MAAVYVLHQDFWNWKKAEPLVFGFLPIGLAYHAGYSILAAVTDGGAGEDRLAEAPGERRTGGSRTPKGGPLHDPGHRRLHLPGHHRGDRQLAFRKSQANTEDFFLANRSVGAMVFFLSLFATNMTAFAILGSSGQAYRQGIGIYGLMASSSGLVIPLTIFFIGTRLWAIGKRFGHQTQVAFFRDRWECDTIGTVIFALSALMLVPYMIISIMGGGTVLAHLSTSAAPGRRSFPTRSAARSWRWS